MSKEKKCVLCGCKDHRLIGCTKHMAKNCSCFKHWKYYYIHFCL